MADVAASACASRALVYHYFGSKHELCPEALRRAAQQLTALIGPGGDGAPDGLAGALSATSRTTPPDISRLWAVTPAWPGLWARPGRSVRSAKASGRWCSKASSRPSASPYLALFFTLRCWLACAEAAGLDRLANRRSAAGHAGAHADRAIGRAATGRGDARPAERRCSNNCSPTRDGIAHEL